MLVVGGNCRDDVSDLTSGRQFGTGLQAAVLEGQFSAQMMVNYLKNPKVKAGDYAASGYRRGHSQVAVRDLQEQLSAEPTGARHGGRHHETVGPDDDVAVLLLNRARDRS